MAEGDEETRDGKTYVWTKRVVDSYCTIFEWVERKPDYSSTETVWDPMYGYC